MNKIALLFGSLALFNATAALADYTCSSPGMSVKLDDDGQTATVTVTYFLNGEVTKKYAAKLVGSDTGDTDLKYYSPDNGGLLIHVYDQGPSDLYMNGKGNSWHSHIEIDCK